MQSLISIAHQFTNDETVIDIRPLGNGLINDTFLVTTAASRFVLQRINASVFNAPEHIMANLLLLNRHIKQKEQARLQIPEILKCAGQTFFQDEQQAYWRAQSFINNTESLETLPSLAYAEQTGFALGHFHRLLSDLDPALLYDTLPGFHITPRYLSHYDQVSRQDSTENRYCDEFIEQLRPLAGTLENARQQGQLPLRIIHGDPKLNNFLFAEDSGHVVSLIDLDTVKPGLVHYDIGDCLRSCCHHLPTHVFDLEVCAAILKNYLAEAGAFFSVCDYEFLYPAIQLIPFELGLRFYTDYLEDNRYFKVSEPEQNLYRAIGQFRLCESITAQEDAIRSLIKNL